MIEALAAAHPEVVIALAYADEDKGSNAGVWRFIGNARYGHDLENGVGAVALWFELNPDSDPKDYGYDPVTFEYVGEDDEAA